MNRLMECAGNPVIDCEEQFHEELGVQVGLFYFHGLIPLQTLRNWTRFGRSLATKEHNNVELLSSFA